MIRRKPFFRLAMILTALLLCLNILLPGMTAAEDKDKAFRNVLFQGRSLMDKIPDPTKNKVLGYTYYSKLPKKDLGWDISYALSKVFSGEFAKLFSNNLSRDKYYFTMAMLMCASEEAITWVNSNSLANALKLNEDSYTKDLLDRVIELATDENLPNTDAEIVEMGEGFAAIKDSFHTVKEFCDAANQKKLMDSLDWEQIRYLRNAWQNSGNKDLKKIGGVLERMGSYTGEGRSFLAAISVLKEFGVNGVFDAIVSESLKKMTGTVGLIGAAMVLCTDAVTRFSALSGSYDDMRYTADVVDACWKDFKNARDTYDLNRDQLMERNDMNTLQGCYERMLYSAINYLQACALMNETYYDYVQIMKNSATGGAISNQNDYDRADRGKEDAEDFRRIASQLREEIREFRIALTERENSKPGMLDKAVWTRYYMTHDDTQGEIVITAYMSGTTRMQMFFCRNWDYEADLVLRDDGLLGFGDEDDWAEGTLTAPWDSETLTLRITGGNVLDEEGEWAFLFENKEYLFYPAKYSEMWYEKPTDKIPDNKDWLGHWALIDDNHEFHIDIDTYSNEYHMNIVFDQKYHYFATLEIYDEDEMYFYTEKFNTGLTLNRKLKKIALNDIGCMVDELSDWLDEYNYRPEFTFVSEKYYDNYNTK